MYYQLDMSLHKTCYDGCDVKSNGCADYKKVLTLEINSGWDGMLKLWRMFKNYSKDRHQ